MQKYHVGSCTQAEELGECCLVGLGSSMANLPPSRSLSRHRTVPRSLPLLSHRVSRQQFLSAEQWWMLPALSAHVRDQQDLCVHSGLQPAEEPRGVQR